MDRPCDHVVEDVARELFNLARVMDREPDQRPAAQLGARGNGIAPGHEMYAIGAGRFDSAHASMDRRAHLPFLNGPPQTIKDCDLLVL